MNASASQPAPLQFLAPYAGAAMAEYFMYNTWKQDGEVPALEDGHFVQQSVADGGKGLATFIAYDDLLSKQLLTAKCRCCCVAHQAAKLSW